jgi:hypothetical protein
VSKNDNTATTVACCLCICCYSTATATKICATVAIYCSCIIFAVTATTRTACTNTSTASITATIIEVPILGPIPVPPKEQVILAGTTATASVAAALVGKSVVEWLVAKMKPIVQQIFVRGKKLLNRDLTPYELQIYFAFQKEDKLKKVTKLLAKEKKAEKLRQYKEFYNK